MNVISNSVAMATTWHRSSAAKIRRLKEENEALRQKLEARASSGVQQRLSPQVKDVISLIL